MERNFYTPNTMSTRKKLRTKRLSNLHDSSPFRWFWRIIGTSRIIASPRTRGESDIKAGGRVLSEHCNSGGECEIRTRDPFWDTSLAVLPAQTGKRFRLHPALAGQAQPTIKNTKRDTRVWNYSHLLKILIFFQSDK